MKRKKLTIQQMHQLAKQRGGVCLSTVYKNNITKLWWQCAKGHRWETRPAYIRRGTWCPFCAGQHLTIADMIAFARNNGGNCLSTTYRNNATKLTWECAKGHQWQAPPQSIRAGSWCPTCRRKRGITITHMQQLAKMRGGTCVSKTYGNAREKLTWECANGHQWKALPWSIKQGTWCPYCYRMKLFKAS